MAPELKIGPEIQLAIAAIAFERAHAVYFPASAETMAQLAQEYLLRENIHFWVSPCGDAIHCVQCRQSSRNPNDVANLYCGFCHQFHDPNAGGIITS